MKRHCRWVFPTTTAAGILLGLALWSCASPRGITAPGNGDFTHGGTGHPTRKAPYLLFSGDPATMKVIWQLDRADTCRIEWGLDTRYASGGAETIEYGSDHQHAHTITGLAPATTVFYRVIAEADTFAASFQTAPPADATRACFLAYGDTRSQPQVHDRVAEAMVTAATADPCLRPLVVVVGDLVGDGNSEAAWDNEFFSPVYPHLRQLLGNIPYATCMGNHERSGALFTKYFPYPFHAARYWSFDYGPAHFVVVDQFVDFGAGSAQYAWMHSDLASTTKRWRFVVLHEPGWSAGGGHGNNVTVQRDIQPLCKQYGVAIVFAGHNHYYARAVVDGVEHITTGGGGAPLYTPNPKAANVVTASRAYHYCAIRMDGDRLSFAAVSTAGDTLDAFSMQAPTGAPETVPLNRGSRN